MTTFAEVRQRALYGCILSTKYFAEEITLILPGGAMIDAIGLISKADSGVAEMSDELRTVEKINVRLSRDQAADYDGQTIGGLVRPSLGLGLIRVNDIDQRPFGFDSIVDSDADSWLLQFERQRTERVGMAQTQGR